MPVLGDPDTPVTLAPYEGFLCSDCARYNTEFVPRVRETDADHVEGDIQRSEEVGVTGVQGFVSNGEFLEPDLEEDPRVENFIGLWENSTPPSP